MRRRPPGRLGRGNERARLGGRLWETPDVAGIKE